MHCDYIENKDSRKYCRWNHCCYDRNMCEQCAFKNKTFQITGKKAIKKIVKIIKEIKWE